MTIDDTANAGREVQSASLDSSKGTEITSKLLARTFGWGELFVLVPLHAFWVLYKSTPFVAENPASVAVAAVPLGVIVAVGLAACSPRVRAAIVSVEWLLHLTAATFMAVVLLYVAIRDPFSPMLPITWPLCFWSVALSFVMLADVAMHERMRGVQQNTPTRTWAGWCRAVGVGAATWVGLIWIASGMDWVPYFLTVSAIFHAVMAIAGCDAKRIDTNSPETPRRGQRLECTAAFFETIFATALMMGALLRFLFVCHMTGTAELKYFQLIDLATTPWFILGAVTAMLAIRFRLTFAAHAVAVGLLILCEASSVWPIPFILGYGLPVLFRASTREKAFAYAISAAAVAIMWIIGSLAFMTAGVVIVYEMALGFANDFSITIRMTAIAMYVVWLLVMATRLWWTKRYVDQPQPKLASEKLTHSTSIPGWICGLMYSAMWIIILVPIGCLIATTMWPPVWFDQATRIEVGEPTGVCHAGGSRSDEEYASLDKLGAKLIRTDFHWTRIQPDPETWKLDHFDAYVDKAVEHNVKVIALLDFDNDAVEKSTEGSKRSCYIASEDIPLFLEYARRTVEHYKGRVYAWEIWNEPDIDRFWTGTPEEFYELARRTAEAVRQVHPEARILGPAMTGPLGAMSAKEIEGLYASDAMKDVDHPTMHMYLSDPRGYYNEFLRTQNAAAKHGHDGSVWITELGDPDGGVYPWRASSDLLAEHVIKAHAVATSMGIKKLIWYCYRDGDVGSQRKAPDNSEDFFGLTEQAGQWKPAAHAYSLFAKNCSNTTIRRDIIKLSGGLAARQLRTALYRRDNGESTLILWFEPSLRPDAHARVTLDLGQLAQPAVMHEITSDYTKELLDDFVDVTEKPLVITYQAPTAETPAILHADSSPADVMWLLSVLGLVLWANCAVLLPRPKKLKK